MDTNRILKLFGGGGGEREREGRKRRRERETELVYLPCSQKEGTADSRACPCYLQQKKHV